MNRNFLRISAFSLYMLFVVNVVNAQSENIGNAGTYITREMSFLEMTPMQTEQVYQINLQAVNAVENLNAQSISSTNIQEAQLKSFVSILKERNHALQELLSPAQFQLFKEHKITRAATFRTMVMAEMLDLSQDQLEPVGSINHKVVQKVRKELDAYFSADNNRGKKQAQRQLNKAFKKTDGAFDKVLSPQQAAIYHENATFLRNVLSEEYLTND